MLIDCDGCRMQHTSACDDCVVTAILGMTGPIELADPEATALVNLADAGLVSPLRLVPRPPEEDIACEA